MNATKRGYFLTAKERTSINQALHQFQTSRYTETLGEGISEIDKALAQHGFRIEVDFYTAVAYETTERATYEIFEQDNEAPAQNAMLVVSIYRMPTGRYEWTVYVS